jgi:hypothetical protein
MATAQHRSTLSKFPRFQVTADITVNLGRSRGINRVTSQLRHSSRGVEGARPQACVPFRSSDVHGQSPRPQVLDESG